MCSSDLFPSHDTRGVSVTNSFVSKMESGDSKPSIDVLVAMADELDVSADYLLKHPLYSTLPGPVRPVFVAQLFDYYSNCLLTALTDCARMDSEANELRKRKRPTPLESAGARFTVTRT